MKHNAAKRVALLSLFVAFAMVLVACGGSSATSDPAPTKAKETTPVVVEGLKHEGALTVGIRSSAPAPLVIESNGSSSGLDVDLASSLASEMGLSVRFVFADDTVKALESNCDIVMGVQANDESYDFLGHYTDIATAFFHAGEMEVLSADDFADKRIAVEEGSSAQRSLRITELSVSEVPCSSLSAAFKAMEDDQADFVLCGATSGAYLTTRHANAAFAGTLSEPSAVGIAVGKGMDSIKSNVSKAFDRITENGILTEVRRAWLGTMPVLSATAKIADIPLKETSGDSLEELSAQNDSLGVGRDGSTAGGNAVTLDGASSRMSQQEGEDYADYSGQSDVSYSNEDAVAQTYVPEASDAAPVQQYVGDQGSQYVEPAPTYEPEPTYVPEQTYEPEPSYGYDDTYDYDYGGSGSGQEAYDDYSYDYSADAGADYGSDYGGDSADYGSNDYVAE
jgi:hypothetical protein